MKDPAGCSAHENGHAGCAAGHITRRDLLTAGAALGVTWAAPGISLAAATGNQPDRGIEDLGGGCFRFQNNRHFGTFVITDAGAVVFDSINKDVAAWVRSEIEKRTDQGIRYVVYSHNHADHISGGEAYGDQPTYISHELARVSMERMRVATRYPTSTFNEGMDLELGGRRIELRYHGANDGIGSISFRVPDTGVLAVIDWVVIGRMPYRDLSRYSIEGSIRSMRAVEAMDIRLCSPGHGVVGDKSGISRSRRYMEALRDGVVEALANNRSEAMAVRSVREQLAAVEEFRTLSQFDDWVGENISGAYRQIGHLEGRLSG